MSDKQDLVAKTRLIQENSFKNRMIDLFTKWEMLLGVIFIVMVLFF